MESAVFWPIRPGWHPCDHMLKGPIPPHPPEAMCLFACRAEDWGGAGGRGGGGRGSSRAACMSVSSICKSGEEGCGRDGIFAGRDLAPEEDDLSVNFVSLGDGLS